MLITFSFFLIYIYIFYEKYFILNILYLTTNILYLCVQNINYSLFRCLEKIVEKRKECIVELIEYYFDHIIYNFLFIITL